MTNASPASSDEPAFGDAPPKERTLFSNKVYDRLKFLAQYVLPALAVFYASLGEIWGFPKTDEIVASVVAADLFLGIVLGVSTRQYESSGAKYAGALYVKKQVGEDGETPLTQVGVGFKDNMDGATMERQKEVTFKVINE